MSQAAMLLMFLKDGELSAEQQQQLRALAARSPELKANARAASRTRKLLHKDHKPVLARNRRAIDLARYLQGDLDEAARDDFLTFLTENDACLSELAFTIRRPLAPPPLPPELEREIHALSSNVGGSGVGRLKDVFGEASISDEASGALRRSRASRRQPPPGFARESGFALDDDSSDEDSRGDESSEDGEVSGARSRSADASRSSGSRSSGSRSSGRRAQAAPPAPPAKMSLARSCLFTLIGAGLVVVLGVIPTIMICRDLFRRARLAELRLARAQTETETARSELAESRAAVTKLSAELKRRPPFKAYQKVKDRMTIYEANFTRAVEALKLQKEQHSAATQALLAEQQRVREEALAALRKELSGTRPDAIYAAIAGEGFPAAPPVAELVKQLRERNDRVAVAAFFTLEQRGLLAVAVNIASKRPKLSLVNFLGREFLTEIPASNREWQLLAGLLHSDESVRKVSAEVLEDSGVDLLGYRSDLGPAKLNEVVASLTSEWKRRHPSAVPPGPLPYIDEGRWQGD